MRGIHSRFGLDCWLRSSPTSPCTSRDKTLNIIYGINAFTKKSLWRSFLALMIWIFPIWYLARKKCFKVRLRRRFCLWLEWEVFDKWSLDFPICLPWVSLFIQTFRGDPFAPTDPSICYWHGWAGEEKQYSGHFHFFEHLIDQKLQMCLTHFRVHVASAIIVRSPYLVSTDNGSAYIHVNASETRPRSWRR